jgi:hypothetical protein
MKNLEEPETHNLLDFLLENPRNFQRYPENMRIARETLENWWTFLGIIDFFFSKKFQILKIKIKIKIHLTSILCLLGLSDDPQFS